MVGLGVASSATSAEARQAIEHALSTAGGTWTDVHAIATTTGRIDHPAIRELAAEGLEIVPIDPDELAGVPVPNPSPTVLRRVGTPSVAEAAALLVAHTDELVVPKQVHPRVTVAVARRSRSS